MVDDLPSRPPPTARLSLISRILRRFRWNREVSEERRDQIDQVMKVAVSRYPRGLCPRDLEQAVEALHAGVVAGRGSALKDALGRPFEGFERLSDGFQEGFAGEAGACSGSARAIRSLDVRFERVSTSPFPLSSDNPQNSQQWTLDSVSWYGR